MTLTVGELKKLLVDTPDDYIVKFEEEVDRHTYREIHASRVLECKVDHSILLLSEGVDYD